MKHTDLNNYMITSENDNLDFLLTHLGPGKVICLTIGEKKLTRKLLVRLIKVLSEKYLVGLIDSNTSLGHQDLFLEMDISQSADACTSLEDVEYNIKRWVHLYENPIIIINDLGSLHLDLNSKNESGKTDHETIYSELNQLAGSYNIPIVAWTNE